MPDFSFADVLGVITAQTIIAVTFGGLLLAVYLWTVVPRVTAGGVLRTYVVGLAFLALMGAGRWADLSQHWEAWIGAALLWSLFIAVASLAVVLWRRYRRWQHPVHVRHSDG